MRTVKCVVWDLDGTVWPGVALEAPGDGLPEPFPAALAAMSTLESRGIVNSVASRTDPSLAGALAAHPSLAGRFVAPQLGWGDKSRAITAIADDLGIATEAMAFVDDSPFERAEVAAMLPGVLVRSPDELYAELDTPPFRPGVVTADAHQRVRRYRDEADRRRAERDFAGDRAAFLSSCDIRLTAGAAGPSDADRVAELAARTHRLNSTGDSWSADAVAALLTDESWFVAVARLSDRFGDHGLIGGALVHREPGAWRLRLLMVSCRVAGRDVPIALLRWLSGRAAADGASRLLVDVRPSRANLELRVLLRRAGFTADTTNPDTVTLTRHTDPPPPPVPWLTVETASA